MNICFARGWADIIMHAQAVCGLLPGLWDAHKELICTLRAVFLHHSPKRLVSYYNLRSRKRAASSASSNDINLACNMRWIQQVFRYSISIKMETNALMHNYISTCALFSVFKWQKQSKRSTSEIWNQNICIMFVFIQWNVRMCESGRMRPADYH